MAQTAHPPRCHCGCRSLGLSPSGEPGSRGSHAPHRRPRRGLPGTLWAALGLGAPALLAAFPLPAWAVGEQNARLRGTVVEATTAVAMPGAKVELSGDAMIGGPRRTTTDEDGGFDFTLVPPGRYLLTVSFEGLRPLQRKLTLELGQTVNLKLPLTAELAEADTQVIVEERKRLDNERLSTGKVLTAEGQSKIATGRRYQDVVQQVSGVTGGSNPVMAGGSLRHNRYLVDGLDITDPVDGTFSANINFDSIAQLDLLLLAVDAQYNSLGGVVNLLTRRGSDKFTVDASFYVNHQALSVGSRAGTQIYEGRLLDQSDPAPPLASYQANLNVGGPIVKQKLWFYFSTEYRYRISSVVPGAPLNTQHPPLDRHDLYSRLKLTWAPSPRHRIDLSVSGDPTWLTNIRTIGPDNGNSNSYAPEAEYYQNQGGVFGILNWDWFVRDNVVVSVQTGLQVFGFANGPQNGDLVSPAHTDLGSTVSWNNADANLIVLEQRLRYQLDPSITWVKKGWVGTHTFKGGAQFQFLRNSQLLGTPGDLVYTDNTTQAMDGGVLARDPTSMERPYGCIEGQPRPLAGSSATPCFQRTLYEPPRSLVRKGWGLGFYIQDTWKPRPWLTLIPGMRIDYGTAENSLGQVVQNLLGFGPRIGATLDLLRDGKLLLKFAYGRSNEVSGLRIAANADFNGLNSTWNYNRTSGRFDSLLTSAGGAQGYDLRGRCPDGTVTLECGNAKLSTNPPHADFITAAIERELYANVAGAITYTYRLIRDQWEDIEVNALRTLDGGNYAAFGDKTLGNVRAYRTFGDAFRQYQGLDFTITGKPSPNWQVFVGYTLSWLTGTIDDQLSTYKNDPPRDFLFYGYLNDDHRHAVKATTSYTWKGLTAGVNFVYMTGAPATRLYRQTLGYVGRSAWRGVDPNQDPNDVRKWSELRNPDLFDVSLRAQYDLHQVIHQHLIVIVDLYNLFDLVAPVNGSGTNVTGQAGFEGRNSPSFGNVTNRQAPFHAQFGLRYQY